MIRYDPDKVTPIQRRGASKAYLEAGSTGHSHIQGDAGHARKHRPSASPCLVLLYALATQIVGGVILTTWFRSRRSAVWPCAASPSGWPSALRSPHANRRHRQQRRHGVPLDPEPDGSALAIVVRARGRCCSRVATANAPGTLVCVFLRFAMAAQMFYYGMAKIIPTQFPPRRWCRSVESVGNSRSRICSDRVGASTPSSVYGSAEMASGIPRASSRGRRCSARHRHRRHDSGFVLK